MKLNLDEGFIQVREEPVKLTGAKSILFISDIHFNFHEKRAIETALSYRKTYDCIVIGGDMLDIYQGSRFTRDPSYPKIKEELKTGELFLEHLRKTYKGTRIIYLEGNHDKRMRIYLHNKAPELEGVDVLHLKHMLNLSKHGIEYYNNGTVLQAGGLHLVHGNEFMAGGGINVSRTLLLRAWDNVLFGHFHQTQVMPAYSISGREFSAWSVGCLCGLRPEFRPFNNWNWGFAHIEVHGKTFQVDNKRILRNYEVV